MIDLDREMRALLEEDVRTAPPVPEATSALRRTRRRQVRVVTVAFVATVVLAVGAVTGVGSLIRTSEHRVPTEPPDTFSAGPLDAVPVDSYAIDSLTVAVDGTLWWTGQGLTRFDPGSGTLRTFTSADDPSLRSASVLAPAHDGGVWVLTASDELRRFDGERLREDLGAGPVCDVAETPDGTLWGTGCSRGLFRWDGASWLPTPSAVSLVADEIAVDPSGRVWVANIAYDQDGFTTGLGISRFDGTAWTTWTSSDGLPSDRVNVIVPRPDGEVWVGTDDGLARFVDGSWLTYTSAETGIQSVGSIAVTDRLVLIAGYARNQSRFALFDGGVWTRVAAEHGLGTTDSTPSVAAGGDGVLWAATFDSGLFRFDGSRWERVVSGSQPDLGDGIVASGPDEVWTVEGRGFSSRGAQGVAEGVVWRFHAGTWTRSGHGLGLPLGSVHQVAAAPDGAVWVSTVDGLARFDGSAWVEVAPGPHDAIAFAPDGSAWTTIGWATGSIVEPVGGEALPEDVPLFEDVTLLAVGPQREVWAGCPGFTMTADCHNVLAHLHDGTWEIVDLPMPDWPGGGLTDFELSVNRDLWMSGTVSASNDRRTLVVARYRAGSWTEFVETDDGHRLDLPFDVEGGWGTGALDMTPDGTPLLVAYDGLFAFGDGSWSRVVEGRFRDLSVAPDGTVWLVGDDGLFRLAN